MGTTARSRAWNFPTSPRSPYKLQGELKLLAKYEGFEGIEASLAVLKRRLTPIVKESDNEKD